jgi:hypothetical protein
MAARRTATFWSPVEPQALAAEVVIWIVSAVIDITADLAQPASTRPTATIRRARTRSPVFYGLLGVPELRKRAAKAAAEAAKTPTGGKGRR